METVANAIHGLNSIPLDVLSKYPLAIIALQRCNLLAEILDVNLADHGHANEMALSFSAMQKPKARKSQPPQTIQPSHKSRKSKCVPLPTEILSKIFLDYDEPEQLFTFSLVSKQWNTIASHKLYTAPIITTYPQLFTYLSSLSSTTQPHLNTLQIQNLTLELQFNNTEKLSGTTRNVSAEIIRLFEILGTRCNALHAFIAQDSEPKQLVDMLNQKLKNNLIRPSKVIPKNRAQF